MPETMRKVAVVTGASAGVGRATAVALARAGFDVAALARVEAGLEAAVKEVEGAGGRGLAVPVDVADHAAVDRAAAEAEEALGPIDVWVNDAMTTIFAPFWEIDPEEFRRAVEVTFLGQVWGTRAALERMLPRDRGSIVNVGSSLAFLSIPLQSAYCASKFACRGFFDSLRAELIHRGSNVRLSMVHLPGVNTTQFDWCESDFPTHPQPVPPIYQPEVPAKAIVEVALDGRRSKVVGSWNKLVVLAGQFMPGVGNHYAALGAWDTQLTDQPVAPSRPANLRRALDAGADHGAHGIFDDRSGGVLDPHFLRTVPQSGKTLAKAVAGRAREVWQRRAG
ncbi:MAG: SDR family oxidoreductase [Acidobacteriota bacterium]|nr:SDR family oxidoreductase [Acidobacteriota bacterium]